MIFEFLTIFVLKAFVLQLDICNSCGVRSLFGSSMMTFEFVDPLGLIVESVLVTIVLGEFVVGVT